VKLCTGDYHSLLPLSLPSSTSESSLSFQIKIDEKDKGKIIGNEIGKSAGKEKEKKVEKEKEKEKEKEREKERGRVVGKEVLQIPVPIDELISLFSGFENYLIQLVKNVGEKLGNKGSEKLGNTTLELYLEKYDLLRTYDDDSIYGQYNNIEREKETENKIKNIEKENEINREINNYGDSEREISKKDLLDEKMANLGAIEEQIMALLDGNLPYDKYVTV
jgi:hypothetical protein